MNPAFEKFPANVPKDLIQLFVENNYKTRAVQDIRKVNRYYVYQLLRYGIEPTDRTKKGRAARVALFLPERKKRNVSDVPDYVRIWRGLPKEVRRKAISEFITWYTEKGGKEKLNGR